MEITHDEDDNYLRDEDGYVVIEWLDDPDDTILPPLGGKGYAVSISGDDDIDDESLTADSEGRGNEGDDSTVLEEAVNEHIQKDLTSSGVWFEDDTSDHESEYLAEEITLFARYVDADRKKKCATIAIMSDATVTELKTQLSEEIGSKIRGISIFDDIIDGDDISISNWTEIQNGGFLDVLL